MSSLGSHLKAVLLSQDAGVDGFDDGVLVQGEVQRLGGAAGRQQGLMGVGLFEALHQTGPEGGTVVEGNLLSEVRLQLSAQETTTGDLFLSVSLDR